MSMQSKRTFGIKLFHRKHKIILLKCFQDTNNNHYYICVRHFCLDAGNCVMYLLFVYFIRLSIVNFFRFVRFWILKSGFLEGKNQICGFESDNCCSKEEKKRFSGWIIDDFYAIEIEHNIENVCVNELFIYDRIICWLMIHLNEVEIIWYR